MNNIKSIADFKKAMTVGSKWEATHYYTNNPENIKNLGIRECGKVQSNRFAFITDNGLSYCSWPKKSEFSTKDNGNTVVIDSGFCVLTYTERT